MECFVLTCFISILHIFQASQNRSTYASLRSILSQIDNLPDWYTPQLFRRQLFKFFVEEREYLLKELQDKIKNTKYSYYELCDRIGHGLNVGDGIHVVVAGASLMLDIPILIVYPVQGMDQNTGRVGYTFEETSASSLSMANWINYQIKLIFNGVDQYVPFISTQIAIVSNIGNPIVGQISSVDADLQDLLQRVPQNSQIKGDLKEMAGHVKAAKRIGVKLNFTGGTSNITDLDPDTSHLPDTSPVKEVKLRKRRREDDDNDDGQTKKRKGEEGKGDH